MKTLSWIYQRIGQMICFALGGGFAIATPQGDMSYAVVSVGFLADKILEEAGKTPPQSSFAPRPRQPFVSKGFRIQPGPTGGAILVLFAQIDGQDLEFPFTLSPRDIGQLLEGLNPYR